VRHIPQETLDTYGTLEPQEQFHQRIQFCLNIYNESVKALRFPPNEYRKNMESEEVYG
jgi:26S proteasome regulatory subunit N3